MLLVVSNITTSSTPLRERFGELGWLGEPAKAGIIVGLANVRRGSDKGLIKG